METSLNFRLTNSTNSLAKYFWPFLSIKNFVSALDIFLSNFAALSLGYVNRRKIKFYAGVRAQKIAFNIPGAELAMWSVYCSTHTSCAPVPSICITKSIRPRFGSKIGHPPFCALYFIVYRSGQRVYSRRINNQLPLKPYIPPSRSISLPENQTWLMSN